MSERSPRVEMTISIAASVLTGGAAFVVGNLLQDPLKVTLGEQFILSILVGGVTLLAQFLITFGHDQAQMLTRLERDQAALAERLMAEQAESATRLEAGQAELTKRLEEKQAELTKRLEDKQEELAFSVTDDLEKLGKRVSEVEQNIPWQLIHQSALDGDELMQLLERASKITKGMHPLVVDLTKAQMAKVSTLMRDMAGELPEIHYDGEDREWLLALAGSARRSIMATSLFTVDAGGETFEGGLWLSDLGSRYLSEQRAARRRGVDIRRIFVYDRPEFVEDESFKLVRRLHRDVGVKIKGIDRPTLEKHNHLGKIMDFIVFDDVLSYTTTRRTPDYSASEIDTRVNKDPEKALENKETFEKLWEVARDLPVDRTPVSVDVRDPERFTKGR